MQVADDTPIEAIIAKAAAAGVDYGAEHDAMIAGCLAAQERYSPWIEVDFEYRVTDGKVCDASGTEQVGLDPKQVQKSDVQVLQNYGRPYDQQGKPTGTYYKYAKEPKDVETFVR